MIPDDLKNYRAEDDDGFQLIPSEYAAFALCAGLLIGMLLERLAS